MIKYGMIFVMLFSQYLYGSSTLGYFCAGSLTVNGDDNDYFISIGFLDKDKGEIKIEEINKKTVISHSLNFNYVEMDGNNSGVINILQEDAGQCLKYKKFPLDSFNNCAGDKKSFLAYQKFSNSLRLNGKSGTFFICSPLP